ncbi:MAG: ABC transporter permease subunit [Spirochaetaceae bacterium]
MKRIGRKHLLSLLSITILIIIWKVSALIIGAEVILPSPLVVLKSLISITFQKGFIIQVGTTLLRGTIGFLISFSAGLIVGVLAGIFPKFSLFVRPIISVIRTTPVISVILLALIWFNVNYVPIFVAFLMAFPIVCGNVIEGLTTVDQNLLDMANTYKIPLKKQVFQIYIPSIIPFILAGASLSLGVIWKVIVAAEVISQPEWGIGTSLNEAKAFLVTEEVFAWTVIAILLSVITEKIFNIWKKKWTLN